MITWRKLKLYLQSKIKYERFFNYYTLYKQISTQNYTLKFNFYVWLYFIIDFSTPFIFIIYPYEDLHSFLHFFKNFQDIKKLRKQFMINAVKYIKRCSYIVLRWWYFLNKEKFPDDQRFPFFIFENYNLRQ